MADEETDVPAKPSMMSQIIALVLATLLAFGGGWGFGKFVLKNEPAAQADSADQMTADAMKTADAAEKSGDMKAADKSGKDAADKDGESNEVAQVTVGQAVPLDPIVANLASPTDVWVRLEMSVLFGGEPETELVQAIHQDVLAYIKTVKLHQVDGASGYMHLKSDLKDLAKIRSEGQARDILIKALLFE